MTLTLNSIPDLDDASNPNPEPTKALGLLDTDARRRTILRSVGLAGATAGALVLGWSPLSRTPAARAEVSPRGLVGWDANDCRDAYPNGYNEQRDTAGIYMNEPGACYGGRVMGSTVCDAAGWHRSDTVGSGGWFGSSTAYRPISTACGATSTKNAWRWTVNGATYRCSDGMTTVSSGFWNRYSYLSICRSRVA